MAAPMNVQVEAPHGPIRVPLGFVPVPDGDTGPFALHCSSLYISEVGSHPVRLGFRVEGHHLNPMGSCHGGMLVTFCDMLMPIVAQRTHADLRGCQLPSMSLQVDFLAPALEGDWVEGEMQVLRATRSTVVAQCLIRTGGGLVARASGTFKVISASAPH